MVYSARCNPPKYNGNRNEMKSFTYTSFTASPTQKIAFLQFLSEIQTCLNAVCSTVIRKPKFRQFYRTLQKISLTKNKGGKVTSVCVPAFVLSCSMSTPPVIKIKFFINKTLGRSLKKKQWDDSGNEYLHMYLFRCHVMLIVFAVVFLILSCALHHTLLFYVNVWFWLKKKQL